MDTIEVIVDENVANNNVSPKKSKQPPKRRNNEKRKEKSRDAARCRRSRETEIFSDLSTALPLTQEHISQLDKASIMRLAISYLKVRDMIKLVPEICTEEEIECKQLELQKAATNNAAESVFLKSIDGFVLVLSTEGDFIYVSENICDYLGITQIDLMGQNIYDYSHPCDHDEIKEMLSIKDKDRFDSEDSKSFFLRLKCTLTSKGRSVNLKSATYKVIHCTGHMLHMTESTEALESNSKLQHCMVAIGQPIPHPSNIEAPLPHQTFFTKHSLDMKFTYADDKMLEFLAYDSEDLIGKSVYEYYHASDMDVISSAFKSLFSKGQCETNRYRFLAKSGGYVWVLTQATLIYDKVQKPESVVCVNFIISGIECKDEIYAGFQLQSTAATASPTPPATSSAPVSPADSYEQQELEAAAVAANNNAAFKQQPLDDEEDVFVPLVIVTSPSQLIHGNADITLAGGSTASSSSGDDQPLLATAKLLADFGDADEIHENVLSLSERVPSVLIASNNRPQTATSKIFAPRTEEMNKGFLTFSEEEPGLTLLKDEPDDLTHLAPVAGDIVSLETHPFLTDMLDDLLLKDGFCPLLPDEPQDPLIAYRSDSCDPSPQLLSPNLLKSSECSLSSPTGSLSEEDQMSTFMTFPMEEDPELVTKAPFISMHIGDDLPLLNSDDLMWSNGIEPMHRKQQEEYATQMAANDAMPRTPENSSSLAELLSSGVNKYPIKDDVNIMNSRFVGRIGTYNKSNGNAWGDKMHHKNANANGKRNCSPYELASKRIKSEPKDLMSSELLQQLISNNTGNKNSRCTKNKSNWLLDTGGRKAACVSQPSESVLMNLLETNQSLNTLETRHLGNNLLKPSEVRTNGLHFEQQTTKLRRQQQQQQHLQLDESPPIRQVRKTSISLLDPNSLEIPSLLDLTQQDYEVNAPVSNYLLQGEDLITALNNDPMMEDSVI